MSLHSRMSKENETRNWKNGNKEGITCDIGTTAFLNKNNIVELDLCYTNKADINQRVVIQFTISLECA